MGFMDAINPEDQIEVTKSELFAQLRNTAQLEMMRRLLYNNTPADVIATAFGIERKEPEKENTEEA